MKIQKPTEDTCWDGGKHKMYLPDEMCEKCDAWWDEAGKFIVPTVYDHLEEVPDDTDQR